jgi:tetratricopeptide (TPR) repeat protein
VITGRRTFSAAQLLASELERHTQAVFVGEPTGSSPNHWGELGRLALPETKLDVLYSRFRFSAEPGDRRPWIPPHVAAELTYADLANGHDPALAAIQQYRDPPRAADVLQPLLAQGQVRAAVDQFRRAAKAWRNPWRNLFERELNDLGYALLEQQKPDAAVAVLGLATELYPESANAWDSYGEACLAKGLRGRAAYGYARASRLDPGNSGASEALAQILGEE